MRYVRSQGIHLPDNISTLCLLLGHVSLILPTYDIGLLNYVGLIDHSTVSPSHWIEWVEPRTPKRTSWEFGRDPAGYLPSASRERYLLSSQLKSRSPGTQTLNSVQRLSCSRMVNPPVLYREDFCSFIGPGPHVLIISLVFHSFIR